MHNDRYVGSSHIAMRAIRTISIPAAPSHIRLQSISRLDAALEKMDDDDDDDDDEPYESDDPSTPWF
jgi:hypothetical protein